MYVEQRSERGDGWGVGWVDVCEIDFCGCGKSSTITEARQAVLCQYTDTTVGVGGRAIGEYDAPAHARSRATWARGARISSFWDQA